MGLAKAVGFIGAAAKKRISTWAAIRYTIFVTKYS
jgi:hypothetical protein